MTDKLPFPRPVRGDTVGAGHLVIFDRTPGRSWHDKIYRRTHTAGGAFRSRTPADALTKPCTDSGNESRALTKPDLRAIVVGEGGPSPTVRGQFENQSEPDQRESIWSVPASLRAFYYALFSILILISGVFAGIDTIRNPELKGVIQTVLGFGEKLAPMSIASAALCILIVEAWGMKTVLSEAFAKRQFQRGVEEGIRREREAWERGERGPLPRPNDDQGKDSPKDKGSSKE